MSDSGDFDRHAYETSIERAQRAVTRSRSRGNIVKDFQRKTGLWYWFPHTISGKGFFFNPSGGPALNTLYKKTYWLCFGWSTIELLPEDNPVDTIQNGGLGNGGA